MRAPVIIAIGPLKRVDCNAGSYTANGMIVCTCTTGDCPPLGDFSNSPNSMTAGACTKGDCPPLGDFSNNAYSMTVGACIAGDFFDQAANPTLQLRTAALAGYRNKFQLD
jgi:hypothetical protein